jgi:hypothetical protein
VVQPQGRDPRHVEVDQQLPRLAGEQVAQRDHDALTAVRCRLDPSRQGVQRPDARQQCRIGGTDAHEGIGDRLVQDVACLLADDGDRVVGGGGESMASAALGRQLLVQELVVAAADADGGRADPVLARLGRELAQPRGVDDSGVGVPVGEQQQGRARGREAPARLGQPEQVAAGQVGGAARLDAADERVHRSRVVVGHHHRGNGDDR